MWIGLTLMASVPTVAESESRSSLHVARPRWGEGVIHALLTACAAVSVATTVGIVVILVTQSLPFFREVSLVEFFTGTKWAPLLEPRSFGIMPIMCGTLLVAG